MIPDFWENRTLVKRPIKRTQKSTITTTDSGENRIDSELNDSNDYRLSTIKNFNDYNDYGSPWSSPDPENFTEF